MFGAIFRLPARGRVLFGRGRLWLLALLLSLGGSLSAFAGDALMLAAGAGYKRPVSELAAAFERSSGVKVEPFFGNMGQVLAQAGQSEQVAVVFGDRAFLERAGSLAFQRYLPAGRGRLVLAWAKGKVLARPEELAKPEFARIALPDAQHAVYGKAGSEFLERSGLADKLRARLLTVATVPQVSAYLVSGEVDAGFINLTEALAVRDRLGGYLEIDPQLYGEIEIVGGVVRGREALPGVAALTAFLESPEAKAILTRHGL